MKKIDNLDLKILEIISGNARIPFKDVAAECGVSRAAIHQRVQHLIENGVIVGSAIVNKVAEFGQNAVPEITKLCTELRAGLDSIQ